MNQTRIVLGVAWLMACGLAVPAVSADELLRRQGRHIHLTTDLASAAEAETLVASFDAAVGQWAEFWGLSAEDLSSWKVDAYVIRDKATFQRQGLIPDRVPDFPFGYALGNTVWVLAQPSEYYTRHLLLHEGAHSLAFARFGGAGPTWYMEGTAEMLGTHRGSGADTEINAIPASRERAPHWGRFKLMDQRRQAAKVPPIEAVMRYAPNLQGDVEAYGWSWAAAMLLHHYPETHDEFQAAARRGRLSDAEFNRQLYRNLAPHWPVIAARWRVLCQELDYGFDRDRHPLAIATDDPLWDGKPLSLAIAADRGWQSIGVRLPPGTRLQLAASGEVTLADQPKPWISQPPGVTIEYHNGRPLGQLLACVLPNATPQSGDLPPLQIHVIGDAASLVVTEHSWLLLRVNDAAGSLGDNTGQYQVRIQRDSGKK